MIEYLASQNPISQDAIEFLYNNGRVISFKKGEIFAERAKANQHCGLLLTGLAGYKVKARQKDLMLEKVISPYFCFLGNKNLYSQRGPRAQIEFLASSDAYIISNQKLIQAIEHSQEISSIFHHFKHKHLELGIKMMTARKLQLEDRISYLYKCYPELKGKLSIEQISSLLSLNSRRQYERSLRSYLNL